MSLQTIFEATLLKVGSCFTALSHFGKLLNVHKISYRVAIILLPETFALHHQTVYT